MTRHAVVAAVILVILGLCLGGRTQTSKPTNTYPDPGYTLLGCFRDAEPKFFDYSVGTILQSWRGDTFPNKQQWWA